MGADQSREKRQQQQKLQQATFRVEPLDRRNVYRKAAADKQLLASLVREERVKYCSPATRLTTSETLTSQLPSTELPPPPPPPSLTSTSVTATSSAAATSSSSASSACCVGRRSWPAGWAALLVRSGAISPITEGKDEDPLSKTDFVNFMLKKIGVGNSNFKPPSPPASQSKIQTQQAQENKKKAASTSSNKITTNMSPTKTTVNFLAQQQEEEQEQQEQQEEGPESSSSWVVVETQDTKLPLIKFDEPWPQEECIICLQYFSTGLNHCNRCQCSVCSTCLLSGILVPVHVDPSNRQNIDRAVANRDKLVKEISQLIRTAEKERRRSKNNVNTNNNNNNQNNNNNVFESSSSSSSIENFARQAAGKLTSAFSEVMLTISENLPDGLKSDNKEGGGGGTLLEEGFSDDLEQAKSLLDLVNRVEVLGLFHRPVHCHNNNQQGKTQQQQQQDSSADDNDDDDDDGEEEEYDRQLKMEEQEEKGNNAQGALLLKAGKHHWPIPLSLDFDDCSEKSLSTAAVLEKCRLAVQKAIRIESRGSCPLCRKQNAAWNYFGRKTRARLLSELANEYDADLRVLEMFEERKKKQQEEFKKQKQIGQEQEQEQSNNNSKKKSGGDDDDVCVWVKPSSKDESEYALCVALALSAIAGAQIDSVISSSSSSSSSSAQEQQKEEEEAEKEMDEKIEKILSETSWAKECSVCGFSNWNEFGCRVCGCRVCSSNLK